MSMFDRPARPVRIMEACPVCHQPVETFWMSDGSGLIESPHYVLIADWVYHTDPCAQKYITAFEQALKQQDDDGSGEQF